jgi:hypothetical protein
MAFESMDEFIKAADKVGEVLHVENADLEMDVGGLTELTAEKNGPWWCSISLLLSGRISGCCQCQSDIAPLCSGAGLAPRYSSP